MKLLQTYSIYIHIQKCLMVGDKKINVVEESARLNLIENGLQPSATLTLTTSVPSFSRSILV